MKKVIILIVVLIVLGGVVIFALRSGDSSGGGLFGGPKGIDVTTAKAERGDITSIVTATGKIFPETEVKISSDVAGEIIELPVVDGQIVEKGDLIVRVDPEILATQVKQQEAALAASRANVEQSRARLLQAELDFKRTQSLFDKGFATQDQVDGARTELEVAKASLSAASYRVEQQDMELEEASNRLSRASTYAPISGSITVLHLELGDRVVGTGQFSGTEIMRIADLNQMEVRVDVSESDIVNVKIGDEAEIEIDAIPDTKFIGEVTEIANSADTSQQRTQDQLTTFRVKVRLLEPSPAIRPGMTATADIKTETVTDVVKVPLQSVTVRAKTDVRKQLEGKADDKDEKKPAAREEERSRNGDREEREKSRRNSLERVMFVVKDSKAHLVRVETGIADNRWIEIKDGITVGDEVVSGSYRVLSRTLKHEDAVNITNKDDEDEEEEKEKEEAEEEADAA